MPMSMYVDVYYGSLISKEIAGEHKIKDLNKTIFKIPIGDNYTMGIKDAVKAVELANPKTAIPIHYNTFPVINSDPNEFKKLVEARGVNCKVMSFGEEIEL